MSDRTSSMAATAIGNVTGSGVGEAPGSYCSETMSSKIFLSISPLLLLFGTFTNIFSLLVLSRKRMRKHSTYVYLAILSVIDLLALWLGIIRDYLAHGYGIYINSLLLCKLHSFLFYFTLDFSSWILVAVSLDRFFAITFIFSAYTRKLLLKIAAKPKFVCSILCAFFFLLNLHFVYYVEIDLSKEQQVSKWLSIYSKPSKTLDSSELMTKLANSSLSSTTFNFYQHNSRHAKLAEKALYPGNSVVELAGSDSPHLSSLLLIMNNEMSGTSAPSITTPATKKHSIGVFDEYFYCVVDESKNPTYVKFFVNIWPFIDLSMYAILPFCIMFICNIAIIKHVAFSSKDSLSSTFKPKRKFKSINKMEEEENCLNNQAHIDVNSAQRNNMPMSQMSYSSAALGGSGANNNTTNNSANDMSVTSGGGGGGVSRHNNNNTSFTSGHKSQQSGLGGSGSNTSAAGNTTTTSTSILLKNFQNRNIKMMSLTIISITCIFILLTLPIMLFIISMKLSSNSNLDKKFNSLGSWFANMDPNCKSILWSIMNLFMYTNHSINFVMYCLTGSKFRTELATLFLPKHFTLSSTNPNVLAPHLHALGDNGITSTYHHHMSAQMHMLPSNSNSMRKYSMRPSTASAASSGSFLKHHHHHRSHLHHPAAQHSIMANSSSGMNLGMVLENKNLSLTHNKKHSPFNNVRSQTIYMSGQDCLI